MSTLYVDNLEPNLGNAVHAVGHVVQVAKAADVTETSYATNNWNQTPLYVDITPKFDNSKLLVSVATNVGGANGGAEGVGCKVMRQVALGTAVNADDINTSAWGCHACTAGYSGDPYAPSNVAFNIYDSPSYTSGQSIRYALYVRNYNSSYPAYYNRGETLDADAAGRWQTSSTIIVMEIAQ